MDAGDEAPEETSYGCATNPQYGEYEPEGLKANYVEQKEHDSSATNSNRTEQTSKDNTPRGSGQVGSQGLLKSHEKNYRQAQKGKDPNISGNTFVFLALWLKKALGISL